MRAGAHARPRWTRRSPGGAERLAVARRPVLRARRGGQPGRPADRLPGLYSSSGASSAMASRHPDRRPSAARSPKVPSSPPVPRPSYLTDDAGRPQVPVLIRPRRLRAQHRRNAQYAGHSHPLRRPACTSRKRGQAEEAIAAPIPFGNRPGLVRGGCERPARFEAVTQRRQRALWERAARVGGRDKPRLARGSLRRLRRICRGSRAGQRHRRARQWAVIAAPAYLLAAVAALGSAAGWKSAWLLGFAGGLVAPLIWMAAGTRASGRCG